MLLKTIEADLAELSEFPEFWLISDSRATSRWLRRQIAKSLGVSINIKVLSHHQLFRALMMGEQDDSEVHASLVWHIYKVLPTLLDRPSFSSVRKRIAFSELGGPERCYEFSDHMATLFVQYQHYPKEQWSRSQPDNRPDDQSGDWQSELWGAIADIDPSLLPAAQVNSSSNVCNIRDMRKPQHIFVYDLLCLSEMDYALLVDAARDVPVMELALTPTSEYMADRDVTNGLRELVLSQLAKCHSYRQILHANIDAHMTVDEYIIPFEKKHSPLAYIQDKLSDDSTESTLPNQPNQPSAAADLRWQAYSSMAMEVKGLRQNLSALRHVEPHRIAVLAPRIADYLPLIKAEFSSGTAYQIMPAYSQGSADKDLATVWHGLLAGLQQPINMATVDTFLTTDGVAEDYALDQFSRTNISRYFRLHKAYGSYDPVVLATKPSSTKSLNNLLASLHEELLQGALDPDSKETNEYWPISWSDLYVVSELCSRLGRWQAQMNTQMNIGQWYDLCVDLLDAVVSTDDRSKFEELVHRFRQELNTIHSTCGAVAIPVSAVLNAIERCADSWHAGGTEHGKVFFSDLSEGRSKVIDHAFVLGVQEGGFPLLRTQSMFDKLRHMNNGDIGNDPLQIQQAALLSLVLNTRESLSFSGSALSGQSLSDVHPCASVKYLLQLGEATV